MNTKNNKKKKLKTLLIGLPILAGAPIALVLSCSGNKGKGASSYAENWKFASRRDIKVVDLDENGKQPYVGQHHRFSPDLQTSTSHIMGSSMASYYVSGLRQEIINFPIYNKNGKLISGKTSKSYLKFDIYDSITIILRDGTKKVFDSDSNDLEDGKSINGKEFKSYLAKNNVEKILFHLRDDAYWVQNRSGGKKEKITLDDFLSGVYKRMYGNNNTRFGSKEKTPGIEALDSFFNKEYKTNLSNPSPTSGNSWFEGSLTSKYGVDVSNLEKMVDKEKNNVVFEFIEGTKGNKVSSLWNENFIRYGGISAFHPNSLMKADEVSDEIAELVMNAIKENDKDGKPKKLSIEESKLKNKTNLQDFKNYVANLPAWKKGFYKYLTHKWYDYKTAGQFYIKSLKDNQVVFKKNENYADPEWVNDNTTIRTLTHEFISSQGDWRLAQLKGYQQGLYSSAPATGLGDAIINKISQNPEQYGVKFIKGRTSRDQIGGRWTRFNHLPIPTKEEHAKNFYFNDAYAKLFFGATLKQLSGLSNAEGTPIESGEWVERNVYGPAARFRTSIYAAVNWFSAISDVFKKKNQEWTSRFAPEQTLYKNENDELIFPIENEDIYSTFALGKDPLSDKLVATQFSHKEKVIISRNIKEGNNRYLANGEDLLTIKKNIKEALDEAGIGNGEKLIFELPIDYTNYNKDRREALEKIRLSINSLDPRINIVSAMNPINAVDGNKTNGLESIPNEWQRSYMPEKEGWSLKGMNVPDKSDMFKKYIGPRMFTYKYYPAFSSINSADDFVSDSLTQVISGFGYIQDGVWGALAYYGKNKNKLPSRFEKFGDFSKSVIDGANKNLQSITKEEIAKISKIDEENSDLKEAAEAIKEFDAYDILKSSGIEIAKYDYFGIKSGTKWNAWRAKINLSNASPNQKKIKNAISNLISQKTNDENEFDMRSVVSQYSKEEKIQFMTGFDAIIGNSFSFWNLAIQNRESLAPNLEKKWYFTNSDVYKRRLIGSYRVKLK